MSETPATVFCERYDMCFFERGKNRDLFSLCATITIYERREGEEVLSRLLLKAIKICIHSQTAAPVTITALLTQ